MSWAIRWTDAAVIILYFAVLLTLGLLRSRHSRTSEKEFLLSGRRLSLPGFIATLVATWYGGILGIGENTYNFGIQTWFIFGLPYYVFALLYALFVAGRIRQKSKLTIPDHFAERYGKYPAIASSVLLLFLASPAPYILSIGILLQFLIGIAYGWALLLATVLSLAYIWFGGFGAVIRTDIFQFLLMFTGFILLAVFAVLKLGSPVQLIRQLPVGHLDFTGGQSLQFIIVWFFIALWTFVDPGFYQRCAAARAPQVARNGILWSILFWFIFDLLTLATGLYARVALTTDQALFAFPVFGQQILPPVLYGLFLTGIIATIMSTIDSLGLISAATFGRDIWGRLTTKQGSPRSTQIGLLIMAAIAVLLAWQFPSVVNLWYTLGSVVVPGLLIPFLLTFTNIHLPPRAALATIILPVVVAGGWYIWSAVAGANPGGLEPFYPGLAASILSVIVFKRSPGIS